MKYLAPLAVSVLALASCQKAAAPDSVPLAAPKAAAIAPPAAPPVKHAAAAPAAPAPSATPESLAKAAPSALPDLLPATAPAKLAAATPDSFPSLSQAALEARLVGSVWRYGDDHGGVYAPRLTLKKGGALLGDFNAVEVSWAVSNGVLVFKDASGAVTTRFDRAVSRQGEVLIGTATPDPWKVLSLTRLDQGEAVYDFAASVCDARLPAPGTVRVKARGTEVVYVDYRLPGDRFEKPRYAALTDGMTMLLPVGELKGVNAAHGDGADILFDDGRVAQVAAGMVAAPVGARVARAEACAAS